MFLWAAAAPFATATVLVAEYTFNDTLAASFGSAPALVSIDPQGQNTFETAVVNGQTQRVFHWVGDGSSPALNAGFRLNTTGLVAPNNYSVEMVFEFLEPAAFGKGWRRILDSQNRLSDNGFYVAPNNVLQVYDVVSGSTFFTTPGFHTVLLTNFVVGGTQEVKVYLDGVLELTSNTDQLNLNNANNPDHLLHFFVDNVVDPAQQEFAEGRIAALRVYDGALAPIVFIPGIAGSKFIGGNKTGAHGNGSYLWPTVDPVDIEDLNLRTGVLDVQAVDVVRNYAGKDVYGDFLTHLAQDDVYREFDLDEYPSRLESSYMEDYALAHPDEPKPNLFPFPYDWRRSNAAHTQTLHTYIQHIRALHGGVKVNVVAHSMGGLLLRRYILDYGSADFDHVMTVGTPWWGAPMAHYRMFSGNFYGPGFIEGVIDMITRSSMKESLSTLVGVHELLATELYLTNGGSPVMAEDRWDVNKDHLDNNGITAPAYNSAQFRALVDSWTASIEAPLNPDIPSQNSLIFHNGRQDNWAADTDDIKYLHVCGHQNTNKTTLKVTARTETISLGGYILYERNRFVEGRMGVGDGVVPLLSAQRLPEYLAPGPRTQTRVIPGPNDDVGHVALMHHSRTLEMMEAFFRGEVVPSASEASALGFTSDANVRQSISVTGSGYVSMEDAQGNTNELLSAVAAKQIPGVDVVYGGDEPWVDIAAGSEVGLTIMGAATDGPMEVLTSHVAPDGTASFLRRYRFIPNGHQWQAHFSPANNSPGAEPQLGVDTNDNGTYEPEEFLTPTQSSGSGPADTIAPTLDVSFSEANGSIVVNLSAHDDVTANPLIRYTVNDGPVQDYQTPLIFPLNSSTVLKAFAEDALGNTSALLTTTVPPTSLGNLSTRLRVGTGDDALIGGFIVTGTQPKRVIVRAIGPSLPVAGALADPILELRDSSGVLIRSNDNWRSDQEAEVIATTIPPSDDLESAIVAILPANNSAYTATVRGVNDGTGVGLIEAYDLDRTVNSKLANISTRGLVQTEDDVLIAGTIVLGQAPQRVLVRAIGPSLPVAGKLEDPVLELRNGNGTLIRSNDNWRSDQEAAIIATTIPPSNDLESALIETLPGNGAAYTATVRGVDSATGVGLVEVYALP